MAFAVQHLQGRVTGPSKASTKSTVVASPVSASTTVSPSLGSNRGEVASVLVLAVPYRSMTSSASSNDG